MIKYMFSALLLMVSVFVPRLTPLTETRVQEAAPSTTSLPSADGSLVPLAKRCGSTLPPGAGVPVCCMFGYVFADGEPVAGAKVTITIGDRRLEVWTELQDDNSEPYYKVDLSSTPLNTQAGNTVIVEVRYGGQSTTLEHVVLSGGQQVDAVLPRKLGDNYVFVRQLWRQAAREQFNMYKPDVAVDGVGRVYVLDWVNARVQVFNARGQFIQQWGTQGDQTGQLLGPASIAVDREGNVYIAEIGNHRVQKFSSTGTYQLSWGYFGSDPGLFQYPTGIAVDQRGDVYVADAVNHRIQKFSSRGQLLTQWGTRGVATTEFEFPYAIAVSNDDRVYVVDAGNSRVQVFNTDGAYDTEWGTNGIENGAFNFVVDSAADDGVFGFLAGIAVDSSRHVYVVDTGNNRVQQFGDDGAYQAQWGSKGQANGQFDTPGGIDISPIGDIYVTDAYNHRVQKFAIDTNYQLQWGGQGRSDGQLSAPRGVTIDKFSNIYVADTINHRIQKFSADGDYLTQMGGLGSGAGLLNSPSDVAVDDDGYIYVADTGNNRVVKFNSNGSHNIEWGSVGGGSGQFQGPLGIDVGSDGYVYVADTGNHRIQKFNKSGGDATEWGGFGADSGLLNNPSDVVVLQGTVFVADTGNNRVQKFNSFGEHVTQWGEAGTGSSQFRTPISVAKDSVGNVYVTDAENARIQKFDSNGKWLGETGVGGTGPGQFIEPFGVAVDMSGNIVVSDQDFNRVQVLRPTQFNDPIATIVSSSGRDIVQGEPLRLHGLGGDSDDTPGEVTYEWTLEGSQSSFASTKEAVLPTVGMDYGEHFVTLRVKDNEGTFSAPQTLTFNVISSTAPAVETWTFLLFLAGDNNAGQLMNRDTPHGALWRLEQRVGPANVRVAALFDGDGSQDSIRYHSMADSKLIPESVGEVNMGDPQTLINFVQWAKQKVPADHYYLAIADHADALDGIAWDVTSGAEERLTNLELRQALAAITENGATPLDILHLDGCLMGLLENAYQMRGMARYLITSENIAWSAFAYDSYRTAIESRTSPAVLAKAIANMYADRVEDGGFPYTIAALNMDKVDAAVRATNVLASELQTFALVSQENRDSLAIIRSETQILDSNGDFNLTDEDEYIDLLHWIALVGEQISDPAVSDAARTAGRALQEIIVHERHRSGQYNQRQVDLEKVSGIGVYYPVTHSAQTYTTYLQGLTFAKDVRWVGFLGAALGELNFNGETPAPKLLEPFPLVRPVYLPLTVAKQI